MSWSKNWSAKSLTYLKLYVVGTHVANSALAPHTHVDIPSAKPTRTQHKIFSQIFWPKMSQNSHAWFATVLSCRLASPSYPPISYALVDPASRRPNWLMLTPQNEAHIFTSLLQKWSRVKRSYMTVMDPAWKAFHLLFKGKTSSSPFRWAEGEEIARGACQFLNKQKLHFPVKLRQLKQFSWKIIAAQQI